MSADPRARWAEQLGVPVGAPSDEVAAAFLRALPGDLLPPAEHVLAASGLIGHALPTGRANALAEVLDADLEAFAARYWRLQPAERLLEWDALSRRGANRVRLCELELGLDVTAPTLDDPVAEELAEQFRVLFALPPRERAVRRAEWLLTRADNIGRWRSALAVVQRDAPALVALEPRLRTAFDTTIDPVALAAGARESAVSADVADFTRRQQAREADWYKSEDAYETADRARARRILLGSVAVPVILFVCCILSAIARQFARGDDKYSPRPIAAPREPSATPHPPKLLVPSFSAQEVAACEHYENERRLGRAAVRPPVYEKWRAGRPPVQMREPGPNERRVNLSADMIDGCQRSERTGRLPLDRYQYDDWVRAGKPAEPGDYVIPKQPAQP